MDQTRIRGMDRDDDETRLRSADVQAGRPVHQGDTVVPAPLPSHVPVPRAELPREGAQLRGRYLLECLIGQGAMGQVWRARDRLSEEARDQHPFVAVKVLNSDLEEHPEGFIAMHRESSRTQKLAHPNIVTVHVFDRDDASGRAFIAMELLEGEPLDQVLRAAPVGGLPRAQALAIIRGMAEGLAYAHRKGIVHSDFKPGNVFLTRDSTPKILDFGIARAVRLASDNGGDDDSSFQGYTPAYAAPEMIDGREPHPADDVFALGIVAYELLTGRHPFNREQADQARERRLRPRPTSTLQRREWKVLEKALAFDRQSRWPDAAAFINALYRTRPVWKSLVALIGVFALLSGGLWYQNVLENRPAVPFGQLPPDVQASFGRAMRSGQQSLAYLRRTGDITASADAADFFAEAYALHPRNPQAVAGLEEAADLAIDWYRDHRDLDGALEHLRAFQAKSPHYTKYAPLVSAIADAEHGS